MTDLRKGDLVWIDDAPLLASEQRTGRTTMCEVLEDSPADKQQVWLLPMRGTPLWVFKRWLTEPAEFKKPAVFRKAPGAYLVDPKIHAGDMRALHEQIQRDNAGREWPPGSK